jgi:leucyl/phenylalanyl-tRNA--protein transferase
LKSPQIKWISRYDPPDFFPHPDTAFAVPDGLLAAGGDLSEERLLYAYRHGIFPWYEQGQPILWWSPDPRCVLYPQAFHLSRRTKQYLRNSEYEVTFNCCFSDVISACAAVRPAQHGTWITADMQAAYTAMHAAGWAHSIEIWSGNLLAGGLYGLTIGRAFFAESMFSRRSNASKAAMFVLCKTLAEAGFAVLDCQIPSRHLTSLGATLMPREEFLALLQRACAGPGRFRDWPDGRRKIAAIVAGFGGSNSDYGSKTDLTGGD